ncbi:MAG: hypothetical protein JWO81_2758, partial [Alphaproteobacteria bacterium]|nr:hypothetical protein [Alphaproteobacteria bacterium]
PTVTKADGLVQALFVAREGNGPLALVEPGPPRGAGLEAVR